MAKKQTKVHLPCSDPYGRQDGWNRTECGRQITETTRVTDQGVEAATCESCRSLYDFGTLTR